MTLKVPSGTATANYTVQVEGLEGTTGTYLVGFYLPGDVAGSGQVTQADLKTIKQDKGMTAENSNYNFDADVNRDGVINGQDLKLAKQDLGASTAVSPVVSVNLDPASNPSLDGTTPYSSVVYEGNATPGATINVPRPGDGRDHDGHGGGQDRYLQHHGAARDRIEHVHGDDEGRVRAVDHRCDHPGGLFAIVF